MTRQQQVKQLPAFTKLNVGYILLRCLLHMPHNNNIPKNGIEFKIDRG